MAGLGTASYARGGAAAILNSRHVVLWLWAWAGPSLSPFLPFLQPTTDSKARLAAEMTTQKKPCYVYSMISAPGSYRTVHVDPETAVPLGHLWAGAGTRKDVAGPISDIMISLASRRRGHDMVERVPGNE